ncbi:hypothetical protein [Bradyrhizobium sp. URHD0069]|uniref:hypothetical protein n=1 Tax=Bradyrhizobium sp. URHD0069 TaxID=1380355 RepID=UPI0009DF270F|nr:hypothetical protein [Bradyrhizobium sp. URHD0069]
MSQSAAPNSQADADRLEAAADEAIAACGGDVRDALKAMIVANEFLESEAAQNGVHAAARSSLSAPRATIFSEKIIGVFLLSRFCMRPNAPIV